MCAAPCGAPGGEGLCGNYTLQSMKNCYGDRGDGTGSHGADDLETPADSSAGTMTLHACQALCDATDGCDGVTVRLSTAAGSDGLVDCYRKGNIDLDACDTYEQAVASRQFRMRTIVDLETREPLLELEHEVRAVRHAQFYKRIHYPL